MLALTGTGMLVAGCSSSASPTVRATVRPSSSASAAASGPCASVKTTTPITNVPQPCAELWAPYQVTEVPPPDILQQEHVPPAPPVVNMTNGAVSQAEAQRWADASNRDSGWFKWAEENDQPGLILRLVGPGLVLPAEQQALASGGRVLLPDCDLYPIRNSLFSIGGIGSSYFTRKHVHTADAYVFVVVYAGPCVETIIDASSHSHAIQDFAVPTTVFVPGKLQADPVLGDIWFTDAGGNCQDTAGPPPEWCGR